MTDSTEDFSRPGVFTEFDAHGAQVDALPGTVAALVEVVQGLLIHEAWLGHYDVSRTSEHDATIGLHSVESLLVAAGSSLPLDVARPPDRRVACICRSFATLLTGLLVRHDIPARARCGFATYFDAGKFIDHWVTEYWDSAGGRWVLVDAQLDPVQRSALGVDFDPLNVPRDRFLVAGAAWQQVRAGGVDPLLFGIYDMWGEWYVASNLVLDFTALRQVELLPWEPFGLAAPGSSPTASDRSLLDAVAAATSPVVSMASVRSLADGFGALQVPAGWLSRIAASDAVGSTGRDPLGVLSDIDR